MSWIVATRVVLRVRKFCATGLGIRIGDELTPALMGRSHDYHNDCFHRTPLRWFFPKSTSRPRRSRVLVDDNTLKRPIRVGGGTGDQYSIEIFIPTIQRCRHEVHFSKSRICSFENPAPTRMRKLTSSGADVGHPHGPTAESMYVGPKDWPRVDAVMMFLTIKNDNPPIPRLFVDLVGWAFGSPLFMWLKWDL